MSDRHRLTTQLSQHVRSTYTWWRRRSRGQRVLPVAGLVVLVAIVDPAVRSALVAIVAAGMALAFVGLLLAALLVMAADRALRRHPLLDLIAGYWLGRHHERRLAQERLRALPPAPTGSYGPPART